MALHDSGTLARSMVAKALMGVEISTVWDLLIGVCKDVALYYGGSVLTGGVIGGVGGTFFGFGLGAAPGVMAGAAIGGWILGLLGLRALVQDLVGTLPRALQYYQQGIQEAWGSSSEKRSCSGPAEWNHGSLSQASFLLANGHVQMVIALLSALMLWISRGRANALQSINQSARLGPGFAKWIEANEEKLHTLLASRSRQGGGGAGRAAESAEAANSAGKTAAKGVDEVGATRDIKSPGAGVVVKPKRLQSLREKYLGRTPGKNSRTGKEVQDRMRAEGKLREVRGKTEFQASDGKWYDISKADMAHKTDAVTWWNETGRQYGAKAPEVRQWMLDSKNYVLDHYSLNRSAGAKLGQTYFPPLK